MEAMVGEWVPLAQARQRMPRASGLYLVRHTQTGKEYVGLSADIRRRTSRHVYAAKVASLLHRAVQKHGVDLFEICVWALAPAADLPALEVALITERGTMHPGGYNITAGGEGTLGRKHTPEALEKMRIARAARPPISEETRARMAATQKTVWTPEMRAKHSEACAGIPKSAETRRRMGEANRQRPAEHWEKVAAATRARVVSDETKQKQAAAAHNRTPEHREKIAKANLGRVASQSTRELMGAQRRKIVLAWPPGSMLPLEFSSTGDAALWIGKNPASISYYCSGKSRSPCGTVFAYLK